MLSLRSMINARLGIRRVQEVDHTAAIELGMSASRFARAGTGDTYLIPCQGFGHCLRQVMNCRGFDIALVLGRLAQVGTPSVGGHRIHAVDDRRTGEVDGAKEPSKGNPPRPTMMWSK
jgi:hypothetical protein